MKKLLSASLALIFALLLPLTCFADAGGPSIDPYTVYALPGGTIIYSAADEQYYRVPMGEAITIYDEIYDYDTGETTFYGSYAEVFGIVKISQTIAEGAIVPTIYAQKTSSQVKVKVTPAVGLILRCGPNRGYPGILTIPENAALAYDYVYEDTMSWGYVTYNGKEGWVSLDYVEEVTTEPASTEATTKEAETETTEPAETETEKITTTEASSEPTTKPVMSPGTLASAVFSNKTVLICILLALLVFLGALVAVLVIVLVTKKKK